MSAQQFFWVAPLLGSTSSPRKRRSHSSSCWRLSMNLLVSFRNVAFLVITVVVAILIASRTAAFLRNETRPRGFAYAVDDHFDATFSIQALNSASDKESEHVGTGTVPQTSAAPFSKNQSSLCTEGKLLFDSHGKPCADLPKLLSAQRICIVNTNGARYVACVPPKNGSSYHRGLIFRILGSRRYYKLGAIHNDEYYRSRMMLEKFTNEQIAAFYADKAMPKYAVVRNPMIRVLSAYLNRIEKRFPVEERNEHKFQEWLHTTFPDGYAGPRMQRGNPHIRSQLEYCGFRNKELYKHYKLFKFEEPEKYVDFIYENVPRKYLQSGWKFPGNLSFRDFVLGPRLRTHHTEEKFPAYIGTLKTFDLLADVLRDDIDFFGYRKEVAELRAAIAKKIKN